MILARCDQLTLFYPQGNIGCRFSCVLYEVETKHQINKARKEAVKTYFTKIDAGIFDTDYFNLFTEDVELFFPKFGFAKGKDGISKFGQRVGSFLDGIWHDIDNFNYIIAGDYIVVEGNEGGVTKQGKKWPDNDVSYGKFCNVFEFDGAKIKRVHIYVDPDFTSNDTERINIFKQEVINET